MSIDLASCPSSSAAFRLPLGRWIGLVALLFLEGSVLASRLGSVSPLDKGLWLSYAIGHRYAVLRLVIATATVILLFGGKRLWQELRQISEHGESYTPWWPWYLGHLATFTATATLLIPVLERDPRFYPFRGAGVILLAVVGLTSFVCWCKAVMPAVQWLRLLWRLKMILLASLIVGAAACYAGWWTDKLWNSYNRATFWLVLKLVSLTGATFKCEPNDLLIAAPSFWLKIGQAASGYHCLGLVWVLYGSYLWIYRHQLRFPHALLLLPIGTLVVWLLNALRIASLVLLGAYVSPQIATEVFYSHAGWLIFNAAAVGLVVLAQRAWFESSARLQPALQAGN